MKLAALLKNLITSTFQTSWQQEWYQSEGGEIKKRFYPASETLRGLTVSPGCGRSNLKLASDQVGMAAATIPSFSQSSGRR